MHRLKIRGGAAWNETEIFLDEKELEGVINFTLEVGAGKVTVVTLVMHVDSIDAEYLTEQVKRLTRFDILDIDDK